MVIMDKKYELLENEKLFLKNEGKTLYRIRALKNFGYVEIGQVGGYIEKEENLSQSGNCWVYDNAMVYDNAKIEHNATVRKMSRVYNDAHVFGDASIDDNALVHGNAVVYGHAHIFGNAKISGDAEVFENAVVYRKGNIFGHAQVYGKSRVCGNAEVCGTTKIMGDAVINKDIDNEDNYITIGPIGSRDDITTFINTDNGIYVNCGCFSGTIDEFKEKVIETHGDNKHAKDYLAYVEFVTKRFDS